MHPTACAATVAARKGCQQRTVDVQHCRHRCSTRATRRSTTTLRQCSWPTRNQCSLRPSPSRMHVACCVLYVAFCMLGAACCMLRAACCMLHAACCMLHIAHCMLRAACCMLRGGQVMSIPSADESWISSTSLLIAGALSLLMMILCQGTGSRTPVAYCCTPSGGSA